MCLLFSLRLFCFSHLQRTLVITSVDPYNPGYSPYFTSWIATLTPSVTLTHLIHVANRIHKFWALACGCLWRSVPPTTVPFYHLAVVSLHVSSLSNCELFEHNVLAYPFLYSSVLTGSYSVKEAKYIFDEKMEAWRNMLFKNILPRNKAIQSACVHVNIALFIQQTFWVVTLYWELF